QGVLLREDLYRRVQALLAREAPLPGWRQRAARDGKRQAGRTMLATRRGNPHACPPWRWGVSLVAVGVWPWGIAPRSVLGSGRARSQVCRELRCCGAGARVLGTWRHDAQTGVRKRVPVTVVQVNTA